MPSLESLPAGLGVTDRVIALTAFRAHSGHTGHTQDPRSTRPPGAKESETQSEERSSASSMRTQSVDIGRNTNRRSMTTALLVNLLRQALFISLHI